MIVLSFLGLTSCEGSLNPTVYDRMTGDNFPETAKDARSLVNSVYYQFRDGEWNRYNSANNSRLVQGLLATDEFTCHWVGYWDGPFDFAWQPDNFPYSDMYYCFVPAVTIATSNIYQIEKMGDVLSEEVIRRYVAEIKACRGYFMYDLYNLYGPVSVITETEDIEDVNNQEYTPRPTNAEMVALIEKDLKEAAEVLESSYPESEFGRMTKGAALMGLLKLYLHEKDWDNVKTTAEEIINLGVYALQEDYKSIWSIDNEKNAEIIFALACQPTPEGVANNFRAHVLPSDWASPNGYASEGWNGYKVPWQFYDTFDPEDKRLETLMRYYTNKAGVNIDSRNTTNTYYGATPLKYGEDPAGTGVNQGVDYVVYRYADVLLALAEALNEINGPNQQAIDLINQVRARAFNPDKPISLASYSTKEALRDYILQERGWELYFEGNRREDLIRHGKYIEYANDVNKMGAVRPKNPQQNAKDFHVLYPIPNKAIVESKGVLKQNPGY